MSKNVIDCRGMACPGPVLETKKALEEGLQQEMLIIVDNAAARENVSRFVKNAECSVEVEEKEGCYHLSIARAAGETRPTAAETANGSCDCEAPDGIVYFITTNTLGQGSPDLGEVLMKSLMVTLAEQNLPGPVSFKYRCFFSFGGFTGYRTAEKVVSRYRNTGLWNLPGLLQGQRESGSGCGFKYV